MRLRNLMTAVALSAALPAVPARAAPVVNTYQIVSRFATGAIPVVTQQFTLAFDPGVSSTGSVLSYSSSVGGSFTPAGGVLYSLSTPSNSITNVGTLTLNGAPGGIGPSMTGTPDFQNIFFVTPTTGAITSGGPLIPFNADTNYSLATTRFDTFDVTVTLVSSMSAVPEASTWATMIVGLGVVGGMARARRRRVALAA